MELPQARPQAGRQPTHDFLSLYGHSTAQQDPWPPSQGNYLKTHDFLQPLEGVETTRTRTPAKAAISCVEHVLPGGIGCHISFSNNERAPKPEAIVQPQLMAMDRNDDHSNCSSYTGGSGFTLWEDSGKTGSAARVGQWALSEQSFSYNRHNSFNALSSSRSQTNVRERQSFMEMIKSAKDCPRDDEFDNEEALVLKKEPSNTPPPGDLRVKVDGKGPDQKPSTPRSKHSATEQRRRSKINDRFQMLREIIPHDDQKRDKASFLLEVIEYIHFLQEKVHKYEGRNQEPAKLMPWRNNQRPAESYADRSRDTNSGASRSPKLLSASKIDEKNFAISPAIPGSAQNLESDMSTATTIRPMDQHPGITNKAMPSPIPSQPNFFTPAKTGGVASQLTHRLVADAENSTHQPSVQCQTYSCASDKLKEKDLTVEGGAISISSVYSKGLLDTLTHALQSSGVELSQASISVQIELGKQGNIRPARATPSDKDDEILSSKQGVIRPRVSGVEDSDKAVKKGSFYTRM
ncbi:hypothetical protein L6164_011285 [Bauhinia variegata]|uniref:Uncharacterized protein n=1 Tax=Bauhinia variegata TaxID=167791 RepID=A0ACB9P5C9_BAUVA|nr:hypothetical protein L6164_011285 [Bauhinia variegata]